MAQDLFRRIFFGPGRDMGRGRGDRQTATRFANPTASAFLCVLNGPAGWKIGPASRSTRLYRDAIQRRAHYGAFGSPSARPMRRRTSARLLLLRDWEPRGCGSHPFHRARRCIRHCIRTGVTLSRLPACRRKRDDSHTNTLIAYAARAGAIAGDGSGQNSLFTAALPHNLTRTPECDFAILRPAQENGHVIIGIGARIAPRAIQTK